MEQKKSSKNENNNILRKIWKAIVEFRMVVIGIAALVVAVCLHCLVFEDWWAIIFAVVESVVFFIIVKREQYLDMRDKIAFTAICFAVFAITTPLFGTGLGWHILGNIIGLVIVFVIILIAFDCIYYDDFVMPYITTLVILFVSQLISLAISEGRNEIANEKKQDNYYNKMISEAPYYKVDKVLNFVRDGNTYYVVVTKYDTVVLSVKDYPKAVFVDTSSSVSFVTDGARVKRFKLK